MIRMSKRYYKVGEVIWDVKEKKPMRIHDIDLEKQEVIVADTKQAGFAKVCLTRKLWEIDKYRKKGDINLKNVNVGTKKDVLYFAKTKEGATIPTKRKEDAGRDFYALIEPRETDEGVVYEQLLEKGKVNKVHTGIASAMSDKYFLSMSSERSSIGKLGINIFAGVVDSGYRGEIMLMIMPLIKDILITSMTNEVVEEEDIIFYPYTKAISQGLLLPVPDVEVEELSYDELKNIASERGVGGWGSSSK